MSNSQLTFHLGHSVGSVQDRRKVVFLFAVNAAGTDYAGPDVRFWTKADKVDFGPRWYHLSKIRKRRYCFAPT
jgi:hypothetical protein